MFKRKKMNDNDPIMDEFLDEETEKVSANDKRHFNEQGERIESGLEETSNKLTKSASEIELESKLKVETERRKAAEAKLVGVQKKFDEIKAGLEKETADMRTRLMKTLEDRGKQAQFNFLTTLLPVLDNLNLAVAASESDPSIEHLRNGVVGTARSFERALLDVGVEPIGSIGDDFNPELHEAVDVIETGPASDGKITAEYARGYKFGDKLLRPARVQVGRGDANLTE